MPSSQAGALIFKLIDLTEETERCLSALGSLSYCEPTFDENDIASYQDNAYRVGHAEATQCACCSRTFTPLIFLWGGDNLKGDVLSPDQVESIQADSNDDRAAFLEVGLYRKMFSDHAGRRRNYTLQSYYACSGDCYAFIEQFVNESERKREIEWQQIKHARTLLREAKAYLRAQSLHPSH